MPCINFSGRIVRQASLGHLMRYWIKIDGREWIVDQSDPGQLKMAFAGDVTVSFDPDRIHILPES